VKKDYPDRLALEVKTDSPDLQDQPDRKVTEETTAWMDFPVDQVQKVTVDYLEFLVCPA